MRSLWKVMIWPWKQLRHFFCVAALAGCAPLPPVPEDVSALGIQGRQLARVQLYESGRPNSEKNTTIIFAHGSPGDAFNWIEYLADEDLQRDFSLLAYDRPGFEVTGPPAVPLYGQIDVLERLILSRKGPVILVGHSLGGPLVLGATARQQKKIVRTLVLAGSVDPAQEFTRPINGIVKYSPITLFLSPNLRSSNDEIFALKPELKKLAHELPKITTPVTIIQGEKDRLVPAENVDYMKRHLLVSPRVISLPDEGHFLPWRQYELVKSELQNEASRPLSEVE